MNTEATTTEQTTSDTEDAAFAAGFDDNTATPAAEAADTGALNTEDLKDGGTPPSDQATDASTTASTEEQPPAEEAVDPFAGLPPAVRDLLAEIPTLRSRTEQAELRAREAVGRTSALQSRLDKLNANPAADQAPAKPRFAKVEALREQGLPEIADALEEIASANEQARTPQDQQPAPGGAAAAVDDSLTPDEMALQIARPTWATDLTGTEFQLWLARQPRDYQQRIHSTDKAAEIMDALNQFDQARKAPPQPRNTRMAAAVAPSGDGRRGAQRGQAQAMTEDEAFEAGFKGG